MAFRRLDPAKYSQLTKRLTRFYESQGLQHAYGSNVINILSACEDHKNIVKMEIGGKTEAVAQTQQMEAERIIMENNELVDALQIRDVNERNFIVRRLADWDNPLAIRAWNQLTIGETPDIPQLPRGYFVEGTSFRDEKRIGDGRHSRSFLMSEFEVKATTEESAESELSEFLTNMLMDLGFEKPKIVEYSDAMEMYDTHEIGDIQETKLVQDNNLNPVLLAGFPFESDPYWNMYKCPGLNRWAKFDVILPVYNPVLRHVVGLECAGTAVRSCNREEMRMMFEAQDSGKYSRTLHEYFGRVRVQNELNKFLQNKFIPRFGGGIGFERMLSALEFKNLI